MSECEKVSLEIEASFAKRANTPELEVIGSGGGIDNDKITEIAFTFNYNQVMHLEVARKLIVIKTLDLIDMIQETPRFIECFDSKNLLNFRINLAILAENPNDSSTDFISIVSTHGGMVYYDKAGPIDKPYSCDEVHRETFEEALRIVKSSKE